MIIIFVVDPSISHKNIFLQNQHRFVAQKLHVAILLTLRSIPKEFNSHKILFCKHLNLPCELTRYFIQRVNIFSIWPKLYESHCLIKRMGGTFAENSRYHHPVYCIREAELGSICLLVNTVHWNVTRC